MHHAHFHAFKENFWNSMKKKTFSMLYRLRLEKFKEITTFLVIKSTLSSIFIRLRVQGNCCKSCIPRNLIKLTGLGTIEWWISELMLDPLLFLISRLNNACSLLVIDLQINYPFGIKDITFSSDYSPKTWIF